MNGKDGIEYVTIRLDKKVVQMLDDFCTEVIDGATVKKDSRANVARKALLRGLRSMLKEKKGGDRT